MALSAAPMWGAVPLDTWLKHSEASSLADQKRAARQLSYRRMVRTWRNYTEARDNLNPIIEFTETLEQQAQTSQRRAYSAASQQKQRGRSPRRLRCKGDICRWKVDRLRADRVSLTRRVRKKWQEHEKAVVDFGQAKQEYREAFAALKEVSRILAQAIGVADCYLDAIEVRRSYSEVHIFFGGTGWPLGPGHAHYIVNVRGSVRYRREPASPHGGQNHVPQLLVGPLP